MFSLWRNILNSPNIIAKDDGYFNAQHLQNQFFANYLEKPKRGVIFVAVNKSEDGLGLAQEFAKPHFFLRKSTEIGYSV